MPRPLFALFVVMLVALVAITLLGASVMSPSSGWGWESDAPRTDLQQPPGSPPVVAVTGSVVLTDAGDVDVAATAAAATAVDAGGLDVGLVSALDRARTAAASDGIELPVSSDYRSAREQAELLAAEHAGRDSLGEALRWVFPPDHSMHVRGLAIDINSGPGADWLEVHGAPFGLCKTLSWEWWHFEWRERWEHDATCPTPAQSPEEAPGP